MGKPLPPFGGKGFLLADAFALCYNKIRQKGAFI